jgi:hypothetical protein
METRIVYQVEVRDAYQFSFIMGDICFDRKDQQMEWVATDVIEVWSEELAEEIEYRLDFVGMPFTKTELN